MKKQGISLIVLVITIIVLAILAAAVIISLSNTNVIGQSEKTVLSNEYAELSSALSLVYTDLKVAAHIGANAPGKIELNDVTEGSVTTKGAKSLYKAEIVRYGFTGGDLTVDTPVTYTKTKGNYTASFSMTLNADGSYTLAGGTVTP